MFIPNSTWQDAKTLCLNCGIKPPEPFEMTWLREKRFGEVWNWYNIPTVMQIQDRLWRDRN